MANTEHCSELMRAQILIDESEQKATYRLERISDYLPRLLERAVRPIRAKEILKKRFNLRIGMSKSQHTEDFSVYGEHADWALSSAADLFSYDIEELCECLDLNTPHEGVRYEYNKFTKEFVVYTCTSMPVIN